MAKSNFIWVLIVALLMLFVVFLFSYGRQEYMYRSNSGQHTLKTYGYVSDTPVYLTNSSVRVIDNDHVHDDRPKLVLSPTRTIQESVTSDIPIGNFEMDMTRVEKPKYNFSVGDRKFNSIGEELCCKVFEEYLERRVLVNIRPDFMKNPKTKRNLELDMYDPETKVAIEYNGAQHYKYEPAFHSNEGDVNVQLERDKLKVELCQKNGINLIVVPYTVDSGYKDINGKWHSVSRDRATREKKLKSYITPFLDEYC